MRSCPECKKKFYNDLIVCPFCSVPTVDEAGVTAAGAEVIAGQRKSEDAVVAAEATVQRASVQKEPEQPKERLLHFVVTPNASQGNCIGCRLMVALAWVTWVGGLIATISMAASGMFGDLAFVIFLVMAIGFAIGGGVLYAVGELMQNVAVIAESLSRMDIRQTGDQ